MFNSAQRMDAPIPGDFFIRIPADLELFTAQETKEWGRRRSVSGLQLLRSGNASAGKDFVLELDRPGEDADGRPAQGVFFSAFRARHLSEQYKTESQFFAQALRQVIVRPHTAQSLLGRDCLFPLNPDFMGWLSHWSS